MSGRGFSTAIILLISVLALAAVSFFFINAKSSVAPPGQVACTAEAKICPDGSSVGRTGPNCEFAPCPSISEAEPFTANFEIYTNGTLRVFTAAMYHNQSENAYIQSPETPNTVHVTREGITWGEFFDTLPFSLDEQCLTTGTGQTFCTGADGTLKFYLNGEEEPSALSLPIEPADELVVRFE